MGTWRLLRGKSRAEGGGAARARTGGAGAGARVWVWGMGRLRLGSYGLEAGAGSRPGEELSSKIVTDG